jgi:hypothetical protein
MVGHRFVTVLLALSLLVSFDTLAATPRNAPSATPGATEQGFDTPEETIAYFVERVAAVDYDAALSACAIHTMAENYHFEAMAERLKAIIPTVMLPSEYPMFARYNQAKAEADILRQLSWMSLSVTLAKSYPDFLKGTPHFDKDLDYGDFVRSADPSPLKGMAIVEIGKHHLLDSDANQKNLRAVAGVYGAQAGTLRDVLYNIDGQLYAGGVHLLRYDSGWLIDSLVDPLIGQSAFGALSPMGSNAEFSDLLNWK